MAGGWMWAPLNPLSQADGIVENIDAPRTYLKHALGEQYDEPRVDAFLQNAGHMVGFFQKHTALKFVSGSWVADIHGELPGAVHRWSLRGSQADQHAEDPDGPATQAAAAALRDLLSRQPIPGLYVAGSDQANVMGGHYPSGGVNIGPAMTFGYLAARHAAGVDDSAESRPWPAWGSWFV